MFFFWEMILLFHLWPSFRGLALIGAIATFSASDLSRGGCVRKPDAGGWGLKITPWEKKGRRFFLGGNVAATEGILDDFHESLLVTFEVHSIFADVSQPQQLRTDYSHSLSTQSHFWGYIDTGAQISGSILFPPFPSLSTSRGSLNCP